MQITPETIEKFRHWLRAETTQDTAKSYCHTISSFYLRKGFEDYRVFLREYIATSRENAVPWGTISRHVYAIKKFTDFLRSEYNQPIPFLRDIKCKRSKPIFTQILSPSEIGKIRAIPLVSLVDLRRRALFETLLCSGCRIAEAVNIKEENIDYERKTVAIIGKGEKPRTIFLGDSLSWISEYCRQKGFKTGYIFFQNVKSARIFGWEDLRGLGLKAVLSRSLYPHLLRHTFCTNLIMSGVDPKTVQQMMGHDDIQTTLKYYTHVSTERMEQAHQNLMNSIGQSFRS